MRRAVRDLLAEACFLAGARQHDARLLHQVSRAVVQFRVQKRVEVFSLVSEGFVGFGFAWRVNPFIGFDGFIRMICL